MGFIFLRPAVTQLITAHEKGMDPPEHRTTRYLHSRHWCYPMSLTQLANATGTSSRTPAQPGSHAFSQMLAELLRRGTSIMRPCFCLFLRLNTCSVALRFRVEIGPGHHGHGGSDGACAAS